MAIKKIVTLLIFNIYSTTLHNFFLYNISLPVNWFGANKKSQLLAT